MTAVTESVKVNGKKQKDRRQEVAEVKDVRINDELVEVVPEETEEMTEEEKKKQINQNLLRWATQLKTMTEEIKDALGDTVVNSMLLTIAFHMIDSVENRIQSDHETDLEERRQKDKEITEQDKDIMALVKELQDPNLG